MGSIPVASRNHLPPLRSEGLVTERPSVMMRTGTGIVVEVFEWVSQEAIGDAHHEPRSPRSVEAF